ncbi:CinA family protein [Nitrincola tapanii]|uniref:CinA family protein n=1 Tax=Nitrincola tapanii TaxID=1708751 RepID=A0A5A9W1S4_9GAMM|nr:CinA family protein [Nitrincola tapanii]KAA0874687.1 CinA family protein [Nitrincola tapanii]
MLLNKAQEVAAALQAAQAKMSCAESCTGGWVAQLMTAIPGSSAWFEGGCVTYSNAAKTKMLGVDSALFERVGAVSQEVVVAMADGVRRLTESEISVAISGVAGPDGGTPEKPVGTVWLAWAVKGQPTQAQLYHFQGDRQAVREQAVQAALQGILDYLPSLTCNPKKI